MRLNKFVALATGISRRTADAVIAEGRVRVNATPAQAGMDVSSEDRVELDGKVLAPPEQTITVMLNKPAGYVCSRTGQGSRTVYDLLPADYRNLKPVGRLDKDSSGLLLLTNDGTLAHQLTHPSFQKTKVYEIALDKSLTPADRKKLTDEGVSLEDGTSKFPELRSLKKNDSLRWMVTMREGRNRQIRRTLGALSYTVVKLHRTRFGPYSLGELASGKYIVL